MSYANDALIKQINANRHQCLPVIFLCYSFFVFVRQLVVGTYKKVMNHLLQSIGFFLKKKHSPLLKFIKSFPQKNITAPDQIKYTDILCKTWGKEAADSYVTKISFSCNSISNKKIKKFVLKKGRPINWKKMRVLWKLELDGKKIGLLHNLRIGISWFKFFYILVVLHNVFFLLAIHFLC